MRAGALCLVLLAAFLPLSASTDSIGLAASIAGNQTLVSPGGVFQLGFFSPDGGAGRRYLGIWYYGIREARPTVVWVANRDAPVTNTSSPAPTLSLAAGTSDLVLSDADRPTAALFG